MRIASGVRVSFSFLILFRFFICVSFSLSNFSYSFFLTTENTLQKYSAGGTRRRKVCGKYLRNSFSTECFAQNSFTFKSFNLVMIPWRD